MKKYYFINDENLITYSPVNQTIYHRETQD